MSLQVKHTEMFWHSTILCFRGKIKRIAFQFTPYSWVKFEWRPASNLRRWLAVLGIIFMVSHMISTCNHCTIILIEEWCHFLWLICSSCWRSWIRFIWSLCCGCLLNIMWCFCGLSSLWMWVEWLWERSMTSWMIRKFSLDLLSM